MAQTLLRFIDGDTAVRLAYPAWRLAARVREQHVERVSQTPTAGGAFLVPLGKDPVSLAIQLNYRPSENGGRHWQAPLDELRALVDKPLGLFWGELEWRSSSGWYIRNLGFEYGPESNYLPDSGGPESKDGGMVFPGVGVSFQLIAAGVSLRWTPPRAVQPNTGAAPVVPFTPLIPGGLP